MSTGWEKVEQKEILNHPRMHLVEDRVILPNGKTTGYLREVGKKDYVTIVARHVGKFVLVLDYSYPNDRRLLQFSEGEIDDGETPERTAVRELEEETGLRATKVTRLGRNLHNHRRNTNSNYVMLAEDEDVEDTGETHHGASEYGMETVLLTEAEVWDKMASGDIIQKNTLAAWAVYQAQMRGRETPGQA